MARYRLVLVLHVVVLLWLLVLLVRVGLRGGALDTTHSATVGRSSESLLALALAHRSAQRLMLVLRLLARVLRVRRGLHGGEGRLAHRRAGSSLAHALTVGGTVTVLLGRIASPAMHAADHARHTSTHCAWWPLSGGLSEGLGLSLGRAIWGRLLARRLLLLAVLRSSRRGRRGI